MVNWARYNDIKNAQQYTVCISIVESGYVKMIYMDHAATTAVRPEVLDAMLPYFTEKYGNPSGVYTFASKNKDVVNVSRDIIADSLGAKPEEIFFTGGGSESDNWALKGTAEAYADKGKHIITTKIEHHAILHTCQYLEKRGFEVTYLDVDAQGMVDPERVKAAIRPDTILISVMTANNEVGTIEPVSEIGAIAHEHGILFHTDAVASYGHIPIDVKAMNIDLLSASAHKFSGPKGAGFLYVNEDVKLPPLIAGGSQEQGRRAGTENVPAIAGMAAAVNKMSDNMDVNLARRRQLDDYFIRRLNCLNAARAADTGRMISLNGCSAVCTDTDKRTDSEASGLRLPGTFSMTIPGFEAEELIVRLGMKGIYISAGAACASSADEGSHVLAAVGLDRKSVRSSVRITMNENNTEEEIDRLFEELSTLR